LPPIEPQKSCDHRLHRINDLRGPRRGAALLIANPVPGQETRNSDFILENGAGLKVNNLPTLAHKLTRLLNEPSRLQQMKAAARRLGRPRAAFDIARATLAWAR
jgi:processive 1,2-diacylglycerol beta-glucosyltransferase